MDQSLYDKAGLVLFPSGYKDGKLYNIKPFDKSFDFSRGSNLAATRVNSDGLIEKGRENLIPYSEDFTEWVKTPSLSLSVAEITPPINEINTVSFLQKIGGYDRIEYNVDKGAGVYCFSVFLKKGDTDWVTIRFDGSTTYYMLSFDLVNGAIGTDVNSNISIKNIESYGNGWYRCSISASLTYITYVRIYPADSDSGYSNNNASSLYACGAQLELGSVATEYIPTNGTTGKAGVLENEPRIDYSDGTPSLLLEPSTLQIVPYSEDFTKWSIGGQINLTSGYLAPDGTNSAYKVSSPLKTGFIGYNFILSPTSSRSIYAKTLNGTGTINLLSYYENTNNTFTLTEEWQRFELNSVTTSTGEQNFYAVDFRGATTLDEIVIWGANATNSQSYATSYIPTYGTQATRSGDVCVGAGDASTFNDSEGVLFVEVAALANDLTARSITLSDSTANNRIVVYHEAGAGTSNRIYGFLASGGNPQVSFNYSSSDITDFNKIAFKHKTNDFALWVNGIERVTDTSGITPVNLSDLSLTGSGGGNLYYGKIKQLIVFNEALTDEQLQALTT